MDEGLGLFWWWMRARLVLVIEEGLVYLCVYGACIRMCIHDAYVRVCIYVVFGAW